MERHEWLFVVGCVVSAIMAIISTYSHQFKQQIVEAFSRSTFQQ
jgi:hypothetical protein